ncbi:U4/U6 small nuclear ribonucleoprotein prp4, partial [Elasticomyces elasticus]
MPSRSPSRSEGEASSDIERKARKSHQNGGEHHVDRYDRRRRDRRDRSRSRSPYRAHRGGKRRREDDHHHSRHSSKDDPRTFHVRYEDEPRLRGGHEHRSKRSRTYSASRSRSRSPYRAGGVNAEARIEATKPSAKPLVSTLDTKSDRVLDSKNDAKTQQTSDQPNNKQGEPRYIRHLQPNTEPIANTLDSATADTIPALTDEQAIVEARRRRREQIKAQYRKQEAPLLVQALHLSAADQTNTAASTPRRSVSPSSAPLSAPGTPKTNTLTSAPSSPVSPANFQLSNDEDLADDDMFGSSRQADEPSAADYDVTADMQEERLRHDKRLFKEDEHAEEQADQAVLEQTKVDPKPEEAEKPKKDEFDMFADDDDYDDMFSQAPRQIKPAEKYAQALDVKMMDNWDDAEGYYLTILGELIDGRYEVTANLGRGMFASVVRATDRKTNTQVAVKIIRNNESMRKAGNKEADILKDLAANDPDDKKHVIRLLRFFEHKSHLCMVFENMSMNLREVLKKFGRDIGINLKAIRAYAQQLFFGLSLLRKCQYLHADLKPDNILVNEAPNVIKIADLGSASLITENATAPYLVSRFYRAPEVILGIEYDYGIDMWSTGCTLFELYTGKILFTGRNNNTMLRSIMECRGKFPHKVLRRGSLSFDYFDDLLNFRQQEQDKVTGRVVTKLVDIKAKPVRHLRSRLMPKDKRISDQEKKEIELFADLLDKCLDLRPEKRITPKE